MKKFNRIISAAAALCMTAQLVPFTAGAEAIMGDVNGDSSFNLSDMVMFNNWLHGKGKIKSAELADMNGDENIDVFDYIAMRKQLLSGIVTANAKYENSGTVNLCGGIEKDAESSKAVDVRFQTAQLNFSLDLFKRTVKDDENVIVSPYAISLAMAMAANGAEGETKSEMEKALGGIAIEDLNGYLESWRESQASGDGFKVNTANSIWIRDNEALIKPLPSFIQNTVDYFDADIFKAPFTPDTVKDMNSWINDNTDGMIPEMIKELKDNDMMSIMNAVCFDAEWEHKYESYDVYDNYFTAYDGSKAKVPMMSSTESYYIEDENAVGVVKPYKSGRYAFVALLPNEGVTVSEYVNGLTTERVQKMFETCEETPVTTLIPKFKYESETDLNGIFKDMGVEKAFNSGEADFYGMVTPDSLPLYISSVKHKAFISLDEEGTKAAAVTVIMMAGGCAMIEKEVFLDRPFVYSIVDLENELPLFIGTVTDIPESE